MWGTKKGGRNVWVLVEKPQIGVEKGLTKAFSPFKVKGKRMKRRDLG
jgi:hypothetical protein